MTTETAIIYTTGAVLALVGIYVFLYVPGHKLLASFATMIYGVSLLAMFDGANNFAGIFFIFLGILQLFDIPLFSDSSGNGWKRH